MLGRKPRFYLPTAHCQVCTTELGEVGKLLPEFAKRGVKVLALSSNTSESHQGCAAVATDMQIVATSATSELLCSRTPIVA